MKSVAEIESPPDLQHTSVVVKNINAFLKNLDEKDITQKMRYHYQVMGLISQQGEWTHPLLTDIGPLLIPSNVTKEDLMELVGQIAANAEKNPYLVEAIRQVKTSRYPQLSNHWEREGGRVIPDVITLAMVLEKLTSESTKDWRVVEACQSVWRKFNSFGKIITTVPLTDPFPAIKILSVREFIDRALAIQKNKNVDPYQFPKKSWSNELVLNILEAMIQDNFLGNFDNAYAGEILAKYSCGDKGYDVLNGAKPSTISASNLLIPCTPPLTKHWADLYSAWNIAFVTRFKDFLYFWCKLLIPSVSGYQSQPEVYMNNRVIALNIFANYKGNRYDSIMDWGDRQLTKDLGEVNRRSGEDYIRRLALARNTTTQKIRSKPVPSFLFSLIEFAVAGK